MSHWEDHFINHPAHDALTKAIEEHSALNSRVQESGDRAIQDYERIGHLLRRIKDEFQSVDPIAATQSHLKSINSHLSKGSVELANYQKSGNLRHLANSNTNIENALVQAGFLPKITGTPDVESVQDAIVSFRRSVGQHIRNLDNQADETKESLKSVRTELVDLKKSIQQEKKRTDEALRRFESQFSNAESERRKEAQQHLTKLQNQISEVKQQFLSSEESRQTRFADALETQKEQAKQVIAKISERGEELEEKYGQEVEVYLKKLEKQKKEAEDIVGAVAQTGMAGGYQQIADSEQVSARTWQGITVLSLIGFVALMIWVVPSSSGSDFTWISFTQRTLAALGLGGLAAYSGKQAAKHGERERHNRRLELEIASVGPFLAQLPKTEQDVVIKEVADRTFGRGTRSLAVEESPTTTNGLIELLRIALDSLTKK